MIQKIKLLIFLFSVAISFVVSAGNHPARVFDRNRNIFAVMGDGREKQLTFSRSDRDPILIPGTNQVVFVRGEQVRTGFGTYTRKKIMMVDGETLKERVITEEKPYLDGLDATYEILNVISPTLAPDNQHLYFITEKYATSNQLVKVNFQSGEWKELFPAESFELIKTGRYTGLFLISRSEIGDRGRDLYYRLVDENGNTRKRFDSEETAIQFMRELR